jgi:hypothetical protein
MTMTNTQSPDPTNTDTPEVTGFAKGATIAAALIWLLAVVVVLIVELPGLAGWVPYLLLLVTTPFLLFFGVPVLFYSWVGRR